MGFEVGDRVLCTDDDFSEILHNKAYRGVITPMCDNIYTIREVVKIRGENGVRLTEIQNPKLDFKDKREEPLFMATRFTMWESTTEKITNEIRKEIYGKESGSTKIQQGNRKSSF